jgi:hypothetical protein
MTQETIADKKFFEWKQRVRAWRPGHRIVNAPAPPSEPMPEIYPEVFIVIYSDSGKRYIKGVFKYMPDAEDYKERLKKAIKKRSIFQKVMLSMAFRYESIFIETHMVRGQIG